MRGFQLVCVGVAASLAAAAHARQVPAGLFSEDACQLLQASVSAHQASQQGEPLLQQALEREASNAKFGDFMMFTVREMPSGREFPVRVQTAVRLQVLKRVVAKKLGVEASEAVLKYQDRELDPTDTPAAFGLAENDVIEVEILKPQAQTQENITLSITNATAAAEVETLESQAPKQQKIAPAPAAAKVETLKLQAPRQQKLAVQLKASTKVQGEQEAVARLEKQLRSAESSREIQAQPKKKPEHDMKGAAVRSAQQMINLRFVPAKGGNELQTKVKRGDSLKATMEMVCRHMRLDPVKTRFFIGKGEKRKKLGFYDSAEGLHLGDKALIMVWQ